MFSIIFWEGFHTADKPVYIHYGADSFSMDKFNEVKAINHDNSWKNKPNYGLWACRVGNEYSWKEWCESEYYHTERLCQHFTFTLTDDAKILTVTRRDDVKDYIRNTPIYSYFSPKAIMYEEHLDIAKIMQEYDGMELIFGNDYYGFHDGMFYLWDVDSIVIWNPDIIIF